MTRESPLASLMLIPLSGWSSSRVSTGPAPSSSLPRRPVVLSPPSVSFCHIREVLFSVDTFVEPCSLIPSSSLILDPRCQCPRQKELAPAPDSSHWITNLRPHDQCPSVSLSSSPPGFVLPLFLDAVLSEGSPPFSLPWDAFLSLLPPALAGLLSSFFFGWPPRRPCPP